MATLAQFSIGAFSSKKTFFNNDYKTPLVTRRNIRPNNNNNFNKITPLKKKSPKIRGIDDGSCGIAPYNNNLSPVIVVRRFYEAINNKDHDALDQLLSDNCQFEDLIFYAPFHGKEGILEFFDEVMGAMGPNVKVVIDNLSEGQYLSAITFSHLEWKNNSIPFTIHCRHFNCEEIDGKLLISKITGLQELPFKPGDIFLKLLKAATTLFDQHPAFAEGLLRLMHQDNT